MHQRDLFASVLSALSFAFGGAAVANECYPKEGHDALLGRYLVYEAEALASGGKSLTTAAAVGLSEHGGLIWCKFHGAPGGKLEPFSMESTDASGVVVWSALLGADVPEDEREGELPLDQRLCQRGHGACVSHSPTPYTKELAHLHIWDRRCEDGVYVREMTAQRTEGADAAARAKADKRLAQWPRPAFKMRFRADTAMEWEETFYGGAPAIRNKLIAEGEWAGLDCRELGG